MSQETDVSIVRAIERLEDKFSQKIDNLEQRLGQKLEQGLEKVSDNIDKNSAEIVDVKIAIAKVDASLSEWRPSIQKIPDLAEKIGESKNWRQIVIIAITAIVTWLVKEGFKLN